MPGSIVPRPGFPSFCHELAAAMAFPASRIRFQTSAAGNRGCTVKWDCGLMADEKKRKDAQQEEDVVGKAYDGRLMRRLVTYLYPYKWAAATSLLAILLKATPDAL